MLIPQMLKSEGPSFKSQLSTMLYVPGQHTEPPHLGNMDENAEIIDMWEGMNIFFVKHLKSQNYRSKTTKRKIGTM